MEDRSRVLQAERYPVNDNYQRRNEIYRAGGAVELNQPIRSFEYMVPTDNPSLQRMTIPTPWQEGGPSGHPHIQVAHTTATATNIPQVTQSARRVGSPPRSGNLLPTEDRRFPIVLPQRFSRIGDSQAPIPNRPNMPQLAESEKPYPFTSRKKRETSNSHCNTQPVFGSQPDNRQLPTQD